MAPRLGRLRHWMARESELVVAVFRTTIIFLAAIWPLIKGVPIGWRWSALVSGAAAYSVALILAIRRGTPSVLLRPVALVGDIAFITLLLQMAGGKAARFFPLYLLVVVMAAAWFGLAGALIAAVMSILMGIGVFMIGAPDPAAAFVEAVNMLGMDIFFLIAAAVFLGCVSEAMERERKARLEMEREFRMARQVQKMILPEKLPEVRGVKVAVEFKPAVLEVGGDYYNVLLLPDGQAVFCVADAAGKGIVGQLRLLLFKHALREALEEARSPSETLSVINRRIFPELEPEGLISAFIAFFDRGEGVVRCASAGAPPALLRRAGSGEVEEISPYGPPIGASLDEGFEEHSFSVGPGDLLCIYTDGMLLGRDLWEAVGRLREMLSKAGGGKDVGELASLLVSRAEKRLEDDATVMLCKFEGVGRGEG